MKLTVFLTSFYGVSVQNYVIMRKLTAFWEVYITVTLFYGVCFEILRRHREYCGVLRSLHRYDTVLRCLFWKYHVVIWNITSLWHCSTVFVLKYYVIIGNIAAFWEVYIAMTLFYGVCFEILRRHREYCGVLRSLHRYDTVLRCLFWKYHVVIWNITSFWEVYVTVTLFYGVCFEISRCHMEYYVILRSLCRCDPVLQCFLY